MVKWITPIINTFPQDVVFFNKASEDLGPTLEPEEKLGYLKGGGLVKIAPADDLTHIGKQKTLGGEGNGSGGSNWLSMLLPLLMIFMLFRD